MIDIYETFSQAQEHRKHIDHFSFLRFTVSEANTRLSIKRNNIAGVAFISLLFIQRL